MCSGEKNLAIENCEANSAINSGHGPQLNIAQTIFGWRTYNAGSCTHSLVQYSIVQHFTPMPNQPLRPFYGTCYIDICQQTGHMYGEQLSEKAWQKEIVFKFCNLNLSRTDLL